MPLPPRYSPPSGALGLSRRLFQAGWRSRRGLLRGVGAGLLSGLLVTPPAWWLGAPPAEPSVLLLQTGAGGLVVIDDPAGRRLAVGGSATRRGALAALERHRPPWQRRLDLLLVPPPHAAYLPGVLTLLERWPIGRTSLLGLSRQPSPALDAWQARRPAAPLVGQAELSLAGGARLWLDTGDTATDEAALVLIERAGVRLLLLIGAASALAEARLASGLLPAPLAVVRLTPRPEPLPPSLRPPLVLTLAHDSPAELAGQHSPAAGQAVRLRFGRDRLRLGAGGWLIR